MATGTGLGGNSGPVLLDNTGELQPEFAEAAVNAWFARWQGCDFHADENTVKVGIEPTYQFDDLRVVTICRDKSQSSFETGRAFDLWGRGIRSRKRLYGTYTRASKFTEFVDHWHPILFPQA